MRELEEETRGAFPIKEDIYKYFKFVTRRRAPEELERDRKEGLVVTCIYHVYIFVIDCTEEDRNKAIEHFERQKEIMEEKKRNKQPIKKSHDENDILAFDTYDEFMAKNLWGFIYDTVILHPEFEKIIDAFFKDDKEQVVLDQADTGFAWGRPR
jgi:hypothetical protein